MKGRKRIEEYRYVVDISDRASLSRDENPIGGWDATVHKLLE
jgi:hypothetical protein